jgi:HAE1 family hydrophobic/amphiphilic exporter-1
MSVAVIGGLFTSTMLTLLVIPVLYLIFDDIKDWAAGRVHRFRAWLRLRESGAAKRRRQRIGEVSGSFSSSIQGTAGGK